MDTSLYLDTGLLRNHVSQIQEERRTAQYLRESVRGVRQFSEPEIQAAYNGILGDIDLLIRYFDRMEDAFGQIELKALELNRSVNALIREGTDRAEEIRNKTFL